MDSYKSIIDDMVTVNTNIQLIDTNNQIMLDFQTDDINNIIITTNNIVIISTKSLLLNMYKVLPPIIYKNSTIQYLIHKFKNTIDVYDKTYQQVIDMRLNLHNTMKYLEPYLHDLNMVD